MKFEASWLNARVYEWDQTSVAQPFPMQPSTGLHCIDVGRECECEKSRVVGTIPIGRSPKYSTLERHQLRQEWDSAGLDRDTLSPNRHSPNHTIRSYSLLADMSSYCANEKVEIGLCIAAIGQANTTATYRQIEHPRPFILCLPYSKRPMAYGCLSY